MRFAAPMEVPCFGGSFAPTPDLVEHARNLLAALEWDGVAHVSFFIGKNGQKWYMETNGRFWASVEGSVYAGWDFPSGLTNTSSTVGGLDRGQLHSAVQLAGTLATCSPC